MAVKIAVTRETHPGETRVAATPESVKKLIALGADVSVETGAGSGASVNDADYVAAGATIAPNAAAAVASAQIVFKVREPGEAEIAAMAPGTLFAGLINPYWTPWPPAG